MVVCLVSPNMLNKNKKVFLSPT